ncbi:hypothetical protein [Roseibium alexandrii]|nr:hypothetical protein [Roseibium alexandrii]
MRTFGLVMRMALAGTVAIAGAAGAQTFDDFLAAEEQELASEQVRDEDLEEFEQVLNGTDTERSLRVMRFMLGSGSPRLVRRAMEFGLLSARPLLRQEALKAVFDAGGPFRIEIDLTRADEDRTRMRYYLNWLAGGYSADGKTGYYQFTTAPFDAKARCWKFLGGDNCALSLSNTSVSLRGWTYGAGNLDLNDDGILEGTLRYRDNVPVPARIVLVE